MMQARWRTVSFSCDNRFALRRACCLLRLRHEPVEVINHVRISFDKAGGVVTGAANTARFMGEIAASEESSHPQRDRIDGMLRQHDAFADRVAVLQWARDHQETA